MKFNNKKVSVIVIILFISIVFIPIGIAVMLFYTEWKKKKKVIISISLMLFYILIFLFLFALKPSYNTSGISVPINFSQGETAFETKGISIKEKESDFINHSDSKREKKTDEVSTETKNNSIKINRKKGGNTFQAFLAIIFFLVIFLLILLQNMRFKKKKKTENPYVDTDLYSLPLEEDAKLPVVHYLKMKLNVNETIYFATETNQKNNEGDFIITNQRVRIQNKEETIDFPLSVLEAVTSISENCIMLISGTRKYYIFMESSQIRYALAVLRWTVKKIY